MLQAKVHVSPFKYPVAHDLHDVAVVQVLHGGWHYVQVLFRKFL